MKRISISVSDEVFDKVSNASSEVQAAFAAFVSAATHRYVVGRRIVGVDSAARQRQKSMYYWRAIRAARVADAKNWPEFFAEYRRSHPMPSVEEMLREIAPTRVCTECGVRGDVSMFSVFINKHTAVCHACHAVNPRAGRKKSHKERAASA